MSCSAIHTGQRFLTDMLTHVDCQAQSIGAYGYGALADRGSAVSIALTGLMVVFVALFGIRLMLGERIDGRDLIGSVVKLGIVLTIATSWPAWRTMGYDLVLDGPSQIAGAIGLASGLPGRDGDLTARLQAADDQIVVLTIYGTGRLTGGANRSDAIGDSFRGVALGDQSALGYGRVAVLGGVIGPTAAVRLGAGILLAFAPLMAGLLLFAGTRDLFFGWLRALGACALGAATLPVVYGVELSVLQPWLADAVAQRSSQVLTPSAPTELMVIGLVFAVVAFLVLAAIARIAFFGGMAATHVSTVMQAALRAADRRGDAAAIAPVLADPPARAFTIAEAVSHTLRREEARGAGPAGERLRGAVAGASQGATPGSAPGSASLAPEILGSRYRPSATRRSRRDSAAGERRDARE
jgi:type IV secretion system protein VirB6